MQEKVIKIAPDGNVQCVYDDNVSNLSQAIGKMTMKRASNVEWDEHHQTWYVIRNGVVLLTGFKKRSDAILAEVNFLNKEMWDASQI